MSRALPKVENSCRNGGGIGGIFSSGDLLTELCDIAGGVGGTHLLREPADHAQETVALAGCGEGDAVIAFVGLAASGSVNTAVAFGAGPIDLGGSKRRDRAIAGWGQHSNSHPFCEIEGEKGTKEYVGAVT